MDVFQFLRNSFLQVTKLLLFFQCLYFFERQKNRKSSLRKRAPICELSLWVTEWPPTGAEGRCLGLNWGLGCGCQKLSHLSRHCCLWRSASAGSWIPVKVSGTQTCGSSCAASLHISRSWIGSRTTSAQFDILVWDAAIKGSSGFITSALILVCVVDIELFQNGLLKKPSFSDGVCLALSLKKTEWKCGDLLLSSLVYFISLFVFSFNTMQFWLFLL